MAPEIPNNWASLAPFHMEIPEGCILNAPRPYPVSVRHVVGQLLPDLMMGCLHQAVPARVTAEGSSALWNPPLRGGSPGLRPGARETVDFEIITFNSGGTGARPTKDGLDGTAFPSGVRTMPVEATENVAPVIFWRRSCGPTAAAPAAPAAASARSWRSAPRARPEFAVNAMFDRVANAPKGREGGGDGAAGWVGLNDANGTPLRTKGFQIIPKGRPPAAETARRRRHGRPEAARPGAGGARRGGRADQQAGGARALRGRHLTATPVTFPRRHGAAIALALAVAHLPGCGSAGNTAA